MLRTLKDSLLAPDREEAAVTGRLCSTSHVAKLCRENGFHSRRNRILAAGPAPGSTGRLTTIRKLSGSHRCPEVRVLDSLARLGAISARLSAYRLDRRASGSWG